MTHRFTLPTVAALTSLAALGLAAAPVAAASDAAAPDNDFARAIDAALSETGEGVVTSFEAERTGYDIEVRLADGSDVDVDLDADFAVVRVRPDVERDGDADRVVDSVDLSRAY